MMKFKKVLCGFIGVYLFTVLSLAQAQEGPGPDGVALKGHRGQRIQEIYNQLGLTDAQKEQLEANKQQHRALMQSTHQALKADREALQSELMKPQLDMAKITALHDQIKALQSKTEDNMFNSILAVRRILTPEQFSRFVNLMHRHRPEGKK